MTHNELQVDIAIVKDLNKLIRKQMKAIDAVFELHRPLELISSSMCLECSSDEQTVAYPCPTINVMKTELG
jgi:hypothetical protein